jgi:hypothetical protein
VLLDSAFYVVRRADAEAGAAVARRDSIVLIKGARQVGKTSLLARVLQTARERGCRVIRTSLNVLNPAQMAGSEAFLMALARMVAEQLDLSFEPARSWDRESGPNLAFSRFLRRDILGELAEPVVWGIDDLDRLVTMDFGPEVLAMFRAWHNERALDPAGPWGRLTLAIAYGTEPHLFITDLARSPFNVGTRVTMEDFSMEEVADLARRHGNLLPDHRSLARFYGLLGGHPYLVRRALHELASARITLAGLEQGAAAEEGIFGDHLRRLRAPLQASPDLAAAVRAVLDGAPCADENRFYRLRTAGLLAGAAPEEARLRCHLYAVYLRRHLE